MKQRTVPAFLLLFMQRCSCYRSVVGTQQEQKKLKKWRNYDIYICVFLCSYVPVHFYTFTRFFLSVSLPHSEKKNHQIFFLVTCKKLQEQQEQQEHRAITPFL